MSSDSVTRQRVLTGLAALVLAAGLYANWRTAAPAGVDFASLYVMGRGIASGVNIYDPSVAAEFPAKYGVMVPAGMFYPPATGFSMLPFALVPFALGRMLWLLAMDAMLVFGVRSLVKRLAPSAQSHVWLLFAGVILLSSALRWAMLLLQGAPFVLGLLCWFVAALHGGRTRLATALAIVAVAMKMTLALPFVGLLMLQRRFGAVVASGATWIALNVLGFLRMGSGAFHDYQSSVGKLEAFGDINSPDPWNVNTSPRLDWTSLFYGTTGNLPVSRLATLALAGLVALWLLREGYRAKDPRSLRSTAFFLAPLVCLGSLCVYHHHYDAGLFYAPVLVLYFVVGLRKLRGPGLWLMLPLLALLLLLPIGVVQNVAGSLLGARGIGLMKLSFPVAFSCALVGSLILLSTNERASSKLVEDGPLES